MLLGTQRTGFISVFPVLVSNVLTLISTKLEVLYSVVCPIVINVVYDFLGLKKSAKMLFHDKSVFSYISSIISKRMFWVSDKSVPTPHSYTTLPINGSGSLSIRKSFSVANNTLTSLKSSSFVRRAGKEQRFITGNTFFLNHIINYI